MVTLRCRRQRSALVCSTIMDSDPVNDHDTEEDWIINDFAPFLNAAAGKVAYKGNVAHAAQPSDNDLHKAASDTLRSVALLGLSACIKVAGIKETSTVASMKNWLAPDIVSSLAMSTLDRMADMLCFREQHRQDKILPRAQKDLHSA